MINPLSKKIRSFYNIDICKNDLCYVGTNDYGLYAINKYLLSNINKNSNICHIGCSGYYNFDIACYRKSDMIILFDNNDQQVKFMKQTINFVKISDTRNKFINYMIKYLNEKMKNPE